MNLVFTMYLRPTHAGKIYAMIALNSLNLRQAPVSLLPTSGIDPCRSWFALLGLAPHGPAAAASRLENLNTRIRVRPLRRAIKSINIGLVVTHISACVRQGHHGGGRDFTIHSRPDSMVSFPKPRRLTILHVMMLREIPNIKERPFLYIRYLSQHRIMENS